MKLPDRIANCPELLPWLHREYAAFFELCTCRHELNPIPWTAIHAYALAHGIDKETNGLERFTTLMRGMDVAYVNHVRKERPAPTPPPNKPKE